LIEIEQKKGVLERLGYQVGRWQHAPQDWTWAKEMEPMQSSFDTEPLAVDDAWRHAAQTHELWLHKKGGIYRTLMEATSTERGNKVMVHEHLWPHEQALWVRDWVEFHEPGRFTRITACRSSLKVEW